MSKHVPEGIPSREQQLEHLRGKLVGNKLLQRYRGGLDKTIGDIITDTVDSSRSPTSFVKKWEKMSGAVRMLGDLLAQYKRDGWNVAHYHLMEAMNSEAYVLPGETVPVDKTVTVTLLMVRPEKTLWFFRWLIEHPDHYDELKLLREGLETIEKLKGYVSLSEEAAKLLLTLPSLRKQENVMDAWKHDMLADMGVLRNEMAMGVQYELPSGLKGTRPVFLADGQLTARNLEWLPFMFLFPGPQANALELWPREAQEKIASWQVQVPAALVDEFGYFNSDRFWFGLHPESEHERWKKEFPSLASPGISFGHGLVVLCANPLLQSTDDDLVYRPVCQDRLPKDDANLRLIFKAPNFSLPKTQASE